MKYYIIETFITLDCKEFYIKQSFQGETLDECKTNALAHNYFGNIDDAKIIDFDIDDYDINYSIRNCLEIDKSIFDIISKYM